MRQRDHEASVGPHAHCRWLQALLLREEEEEEEEEGLAGRTRSCDRSQVIGHRPHALAAEAGDGRSCDRRFLQSTTTHETHP